MGYIPLHRKILGGQSKLAKGVLTGRTTNKDALTGRTTNKDALTGRTTNKATRLSVTMVDKCFRHGFNFRCRWLW